MGADELSAALWRERRQLELLLFRLETQLLHLKADHIQWLSLTSADLESVLDALRFETFARTVEAAAVAAEWGAPAEPTLPELASAAPAGIWGELLLEHHREVRNLLVGIRSAREANILALRSAVEGLERDAEAAAASAEPAETLALPTQHAAKRALAVVQGCAESLVEEFLGPA